MPQFSLQTGAVRQYVIYRKVRVSNALMESGVRLLKAGCMAGLFCRFPISSAGAIMDFKLILCSYNVFGGEALWRA